MLLVAALRNDLGRGRETEIGLPALSKEVPTNAPQTLQDVGRPNPVPPRESAPTAPEIEQGRPQGQQPPVSIAPVPHVQAEGDGPSGLFRNHRASLAPNSNNVNALLELLLREFPLPLPDFTALAAVHSQHDGTLNSEEIRAILTNLSYLNVRTFSIADDEPLLPKKRIRRDSQFNESSYREPHTHPAGDFRAAWFYQDDPADPSMYGVLTYPTAMARVHPIDAPARPSFFWRPRVGANPYVYNPVNRVDTNLFFDCLMDRLLAAGLIDRKPSTYLRSLVQRH